MRHLRWVLGLAISAVALFVAFNGVDWSDVHRALAEANYGLLLAPLPLLLILLVMKAHRWRLLFHPDASPSLISSFGALTIGYMTGTILPLQLGEVARAYVLGESTGMKKMRVLSTVAVERLLDTIVLLLFLALLIPFVELPRFATVTAGLIFVACLAASALVGLAVADRGMVERWLDRLLRALPDHLRETGQRWAHSLLDGLSALSAPKVVASVVFWTVASWITSAGAVYLILRAFSLEVPVTAAPFLLVVTTFGFFVPSSPGAVGVYDAISIKSLTTVFSVPQAPATSYALVAHLLYSLTPTVLGAAFFVWHHLSLARIRAWSEAQAVSGTVELKVAADAQDTAVT